MTLSASDTRATRGARPTLLTGALVYLVANLIHAGDHERQGTGRLTTEVMAGGYVLLAAMLVTLVLIWRRHPRAPLAAAAVGVGSAIGIVASHLLPHWSAFSDPYPDVNVDALSWVIVLVEISAALLLGVLGLRDLREQSEAAAPPAGGPAPA